LGWSEAKTVPIHEVFQGVLLPEGTKKVYLQFNPLVRFAWIAHIIWLVANVLQEFRMRIGLRCTSKGASIK